jgi:hypothetical protein
VIPVAAIAAAALLSAAQAAPGVEKGGTPPARDPDAAVIENLELLERLELLQHLDVLAAPAPFQAPEEPPKEPPPEPPPRAPTKSSPTRTAPQEKPPAPR